MSPSLAVDPRGNRGTDDPADLSWLDIVLAAALHLALFAALLAAGMWHPQQPFHPRVVTVRMIQPTVRHHQQARHVTKPKAPTKPEPRPHHPAPATPQPTPKPEAKPSPASVPQPAPKPQAAPKASPKPQVQSKPKVKPKAKPEHHPAIKPKTKSKTKAKPKAKARPQHRARPKSKARPFDPFKPLESPEDISTPLPAPAVSPSVRELQQRQLSAQELNRYIARIQAAVQKHWKVPAHIRYDRDPLVQMTLNPDGSVQHVDIIESSGNAALDASLIRAIQAAAPFSIPREQFEVFRDNKIRFHPLR